jgi:predicted dehydrogenase
MSKTRIALAGLGVIGRKHAAAMAESSTVELTAVIDANPALADLAREHGAAFHGSLDELFEKTAVDGVLLATPNAMHASQGIACVERGLHVLVEKPFATDVDEARTLVEAGKKHNISILAGQYRRFNTQVETARDIVRSGAIGDLVGVSAIWAMKKHDEYYDVAWRTEPGGGPILTNLIHDVDCLRWICGEITSVSAQATNRTRGHAVEDTAAITLGFESGALGTVLLSDVAPSPWAFEASTTENADFFHMDDCCYRFMGTKGCFDFPLMRIWNFPENVPQRWDYPMAKSHRPVGPGKPLNAQMEHFGRVIRGEEEPRTSGADGARTLAATLAVTEASKTHRTVTPATIRG